MNNMEWKKKIYEGLATYANIESIDYCVLNGYDPEKESFGRDLDVYVPNHQDSIKLLSFFKKTLEKNDVKWIMMMDPIWGMRCVGITKDFKNIEFHIFNSVFVTFFKVSKAFKLNAKSYGNVNLKLDPLYMLFKSVLIKKNREILKLKNLWRNEKPSKFLEGKKQYLGDLIGQDFINLLLQEDLNKKDLKQLRKFFILFLFKSFLLPISSFIQIFRSFYIKKIKTFNSPCVPKFIIFENNFPNSELFKNSLEDKLKEVFKKVHVETTKNNKLSSYKIKYIQSIQTLYILISETKNKNSARYSDYERISFDINKDFKSELENISNEILSKMKNFNKKWEKKLSSESSRIV